MINLEQLVKFYLELIQQKMPISTHLKKILIMDLRSHTTMETQKQIAMANQLSKLRYNVIKKLKIHQLILSQTMDATMFFNSSTKLDAKLETLVGYGNGLLRTSGSCSLLSS